MFPDAFWIEITSTKTGDKYKFEFDIIDDPTLNTPINFWKSDLQGDNYELHKDSTSVSIRNQKDIHFSYNNTQKL